MSLNAENWRSLPPDVRRVASYVDYFDLEQYAYQYRRSVCFFGESDTERFDNDKCLRLDDDKPNVVVLGDSHAAQYWRAIALRYPEYNVLQATASGCRPILPTRGAKRCTDIVEYVLGPLAETGRLSRIVLAGRWTSHEVERVAATVRALRERDIPVSVIGPVPEYEGDFPLLMARAMQSHVSSMKSLMVKGRQSVDAALRPAVEAAGGQYVSVFDIECPNGNCVYLTEEGVPFHFDYGHLTLEASRYVVDRMPAF